MNAPNITIGVPWMFWSGLALVMVGLPILAWALLADWFLGRGVARRRCGRCWYDMGAVAGLTCPECGRTARGEHALRKHRRRWGWVTGGVVLILLGVPGAANGRLARMDWVRALPSWVLIGIADRFWSPPGLASGGPRSPGGFTFAERARLEVEDRYTRGRLSLGTRRAVASRTFGPGAQPLGLETRGRWPVGVPIVVRAVPRFTGPRAREVRAVSGWPGGDTVAASDRGVRWYGMAAYPMVVWDCGLVTIGTPPVGATQITLAARVYEGDDVVWSGPVTWPVSIGGTPNEVIAPVRDAAADEAVRDAVAVATLHFDGGGGRLMMERPVDATLDNVTVALRIAFVRDGAEVCHARVRWRLSELEAHNLRAFFGTPAATYPGFNRVSAAVAGDSAALAAAGPEDSWIIVITGDVALALADFEATRYWAGRVEIPLSGLRGR